MIGMLAFSLIGLYLFRGLRNLSIEKLTERFLLIFPFSFFIPVGNFNINSTEFYGLILGLSYLFGARKKFTLRLQKHLFYFSLFFFLVIITLLLNNDLKQNILIVIRYSIYLFFVIILRKIRWNINFEKQILKGYYVIVILTFIEVAYRSLFHNFNLNSISSMGWKSILIQLGLYPQTISLELIQSWSSIGGISSIFPVHHAYAIYLCTITFILCTNLIKSISFKKRIQLALLNVILIFGSQSRALFLFIILILPFLLKGHLSRKVIFNSLITGAAIIGFASGQILDRISSLVSTSVDLFNLFWSVGFYEFSYVLANSIKYLSDYSTGARMLYNLNSIQLILKNPIFGSGDYGFELKGISRANPHNFYMHIAQKYGVITLLIFIKFLFATIKMKHNWRKGELILFILCISIFINPFTDLRSCFLIIFLLGLNSSEENENTTYNIILPTRKEL